MLSRQIVASMDQFEINATNIKTNFKQARKNNQNIKIKKWFKKILNKKLN